jgi:hypothetical protein
LCTENSVKLIYNSIICIRFEIEFDSPQFVAAQSVHAGAERRDGQIVLVDDQPGRQARQVGPTPSHFHGNFEIREEARTSQKEGKHHHLQHAKISLTF